MSISPYSGKSYGGAKTTSSSSSNTVQYDAKTGQKLAAGASTTDALGNTYKQGQEFSTGSSAKNSGFTQIGNTNYRNSYLEQNPQLNTQPEQVDTAQPSPANVPVGQGLPGGNINQFDPNTGKPLALGQSVVSPTGETITQGTPFKQAFQQTKALGTPVAKTMGEAASTIQQTVPNESNLASPLTSIVDTDSNFDSIFTMFDDFYSPVKQKQSLLEEYKSMESSLGINAINAELLNSKRIIEGTEDDIRSEVQAVSGFATDSQVIALSNARNKSLVKNYNYLLEARDSAMTQLNTMMNLSIQDRQMAEKEFDTKMNFAFKVQEFKQKAVDNAKEGYNNVINTVGYKGLYDSLLKSGDKTAIGTVEKTLGLASGQLATLASQRDLDREYKIAQINSANRANQPDEGSAPKVTSINGVDSIWDSQTQTFKPITLGASGKNTLQQAESEGNITTIDSLTKNNAIRSVVGPTGIARFIGRGFDNATGSRQNYIAEVEKLRSQLTLDSLINAKAKGATFGALSEGELDILSKSASKLGTWAITDKSGKVTGYNASEKAFKAELDKINSYAKLDYIIKGGDPTSVGVQVMPDGSLVTQNSDGTYTQIQ